MIRYQIIATSWGPFVSVTTDRGLRATVLPHEIDKPIEQVIAYRWPAATLSHQSIGNLRRAVVNYFKGKAVTFDVPLDLGGVTVFRQAVLEACRRIPYGRTATYADLARAVGRSAATRAVGSTMANNPLPLVIPCHRVIRSDGSLGGFSAPDGIVVKRRLLELEGALDAFSDLHRRAG